MKLDASANVAAAETCSSSGLLMALTAVPVLLLTMKLWLPTCKAPTQHTHVASLRSKARALVFVGPHACQALSQALGPARPLQSKQLCILTDTMLRPGTTSL